MNDDTAQMTNKNLDDENSKKADDDHLNKTSSNSNVFSRLMHSETHVQKTMIRLWRFFFSIAIICCDLH